MRHSSLMLLFTPLFALSAAVSAGESTAAMQARLRALAAASSCKVSAECRTVPLGAKACGGPQGWLAVNEENFAQAQALAGRYAERRKAEVAADGAQSSDCRVLADPGAVCQAGWCVPRAAGAGNRVD